MPGSALKKIPLLLEQCLFSGTAFLVNVALVKLLDLGQYGLYASLIIVAHLLLGISQALVIQPMQIHVSRPESPSSYRVVLFAIQCLLIVLFTVALLIFKLTGLSYLNLGQQIILPFCLYLAAFILQDFYRKYFLATGRQGMALALGVAYSVLTIGSLFVSLYYPIADDLTGYLLLLSFGYLVPLIMATVAYCRKMTWPTPASWKRYLHVHFVEGQWLLYAAVVQWLSSNLYVMTSGLLIGIEALGVLRFIQSIFGLINILLQTIENYVLPQLSRAYRVSMEHCYAAFSRALGPYQLVVLVGLAVMCVFAEQVLRLAGSPEFVPYAYVVRGMALLYVIIIIAYPIRLLIRITELNKSYFTAYVISLLFSLLSYHFLLSQFGVSGAVIGLIMNQLILQATWLVVLNKNHFKIWKLYIS